MQRALDRCVDFIICPFTEPYYEYIAPYLQNFADKMFVWFPTAPDSSLFTDRKRPLTEREPKILGNGAIKETSKKKGYTTRTWAHKQPFIHYVPHFLYDKSTPSGREYPKMLSQYAASIALTDDHIVPKYLEIPLAGCICFASDHQDYRNMGFIDGVNCYFVDKTSLKEKSLHFLNHIEGHQAMADAGRKLVENNWTSKHFAKFIYDHAKKNCNTST